jgi:hypothetical protein
MGAASRLLLVGPSALLGMGDNDEMTLSRLIGVSSRVIWATEAACATIVVAFVIAQFPRHERIRTISWTGAGTILGWASLLTFGRYIGLPI